MDTHIGTLYMHYALNLRSIGVNCLKGAKGYEDK